MKPVSTYRLQLHRGFGFRDAAALLPHLHALGITHVYLSPIHRARSGSLHGYDVVDHRALNPELGDFGEFAARLRELGMGMILDVVPNHMCISDPASRWWQDVLEFGPASPFARFFDIDWRPPKAELADKVLQPFLHDQYGRVLEDQEIQARAEDGAFHVEYRSLRFPLTPKSWTAVLERLPPSDEIKSIVASLTHLPDLRAEKEVLRKRIAALDVAPALAELNGRRGDPRSFDALEALLEKQYYRLCHWQVAADEINYRRFFDVNDLAAIRVEEPEVFEAVHALPLSLGADGLRIDHVDGLFDPKKYLEDLRAKAPDAYIVVEKILGRDEPLREDWPVEGTTGYDFANRVNGLFVYRPFAKAFRSLFERFTHVATGWSDTAYSSQRLVLQIAMTGEIAMLASQLDRISEQHRWSRDFTLESLRNALRVVIACFPVYRSYLRNGEASDGDRGLVLRAIREAQRRSPATGVSVFEFIREVLLGNDPEGLTDDQRAERRRFTMRFQQITSPVTAKGIEDTACYRWFPLASLNEVGGDPGGFGESRPDVHRWLRRRRDRWPLAMSATSTHDTKRGEDVRARINVLSEMPAAWYRALLRWRKMNGTLDGPTEYLLYQTLVGAWPISVERVEEYMIKASREAKRRTSWINPNAEFEGALRDFVRRILSSEPFLEDFRAFALPVHEAGAKNSLAQVLLKIAAPGVPDFYQGTEWTGFTLVDPDNRRPVDFARLPDAKTELIGRALRFRRDHAALFAAGRYRPVAVRGPRRDHVFAFSRSHRGEEVVAVVGRFFTRLGPWEDTRLAIPDGPWRDVLTDLDLASPLLTEVLGDRPAALLAGAGVSR